MDAGPLLGTIARRLQEVGLEAVLIGNAAAALQGAPVTTVDFDFLFRDTPRNRGKLKTLARKLGATILRPYYPASNLYRLVRDDDGLQVDFMTTIHGIRSYEGVRDRASLINVGGAELRVASLAISTRASAPQVGPATGLFSKSCKPHMKKRPGRRARLAAVAREDRRNLIELVRRWQALPPSRRTNFLRRRIGARGSAL